MSAHTADTVSQSVSVLTLSARIGESGSITHLPEIVRPVGWAAYYAGAEQLWEGVSEARVAPLLTEIATAEPPADGAQRSRRRAGPLASPRGRPSPPVSRR